MWGATLTKTGTNMTFKFQSTLPVWGATTGVAALTKASVISIHAPRVGSDNVPLGHNVLIMPFQSTLPVWGATTGVAALTKASVISIHAPRVGSDVP